VTKKKQNRSIFLAAPYTGLLTKQGLIDSTHKAWLLEIINYFEKNNISVFNSHKREHWGGNLYAPSDAIKADFDGISNADCIVATIGEPQSPPSPGVLMELGFAAALKKPIVIFIRGNKNEQLEGIPYLARGLPAYTNVKIIYFKTNNDLFREFDAIGFSNKS